MSAARRRTVQKHLYFSAVEWDRILRRMRSTQYRTFSQYARDVLTGGRIEVFYRREADQELLGQLGRIGNNINQIARWANTVQGVTLEVSMQTLSLLEEVRRLVADDVASASGDYQGSASEDNPQIGD